jgi:hypothetical protein
MKKISNIIVFAFCVFAISSCVKDRLYAPNVTIDPNNPQVPLESTIKLTINEFLASNSTVSVPGNTNFPDWIEIYNAGETDVNLAGYCITDDLTSKDKYIIPSGSSSTIIKSKSYLLILADDSVALGPLHTNFKLSSAGESIGLYTPSLIGLDSITYTAQTTDKSYGRLPNGNGSWQQLTTPTPNAANF